LSLQTGVQAFVDGSRLARRPDLLAYTLIPALISLVIISVGTWVAFEQIDSWGSALKERLPSWLSFLEVVLVPLFYVIGVVLGVWLFGLFAVVIASPFLGTLSSAVERKVYGHGPEEAGPWWASIGSALIRELRKLGYHLPRLLLVFVLTLIPVVNAAAPFIWLLFGAWTMAVQFCDFPVENRQRPFKETLAMLQRNRSAALGFGLCTALVLAIPLVNFFLIPIAVSGGTLLWHNLARIEDAT
jgi:CysZ protein